MPRATTPLNELQLKNAAVDPGKKIKKLFDGNGLHLEVNQKGSKLWRMKYRFGGVEKRLSFGVYPLISLKDARNKCIDARRLLDQNIDPGAVRKEEKEAVKIRHAATFREWSDLWFSHWSKTNSERHAGYVLRRLEADVYPTLGSRPIDEITTPDIVSCVRAVSDRGCSDLATRIHQSIGQVFRYALANAGSNGHPEGPSRNPAADIKPSDIIAVRDQVNHARIPVTDLPAFFAAVDKLHLHQITRYGLYLLMHCFTRTGEIIGARWEEIDFEKAEWRIPKERMKMKTPHIVPLSIQALELFKKIYKITGENEYVFPKQIAGKPVIGGIPHMSNNTFLAVIKRAGYKGKLTGHGFRGIASTHLHEMQYDEQWIELQLAHQERSSVKAAYNYAKHLPQRRQMMQDYSDYLDSVLNGTK